MGALLSTKTTAKYNKTALGLVVNCNVDGQVVPVFIILIAYKQRGEKSSREIDDVVESISV